MSAEKKSAGYWIILKIKNYWFAVKKADIALMNIVNFVVIKAVLPKEFDCFARRAAISFDPNLHDPLASAILNPFGEKCRNHEFTARLLARYDVSILD